MSAPVDEFDLDIRLGEVPAPTPHAVPMVMRTAEGACPSDDCSSYPMCKTTERTC
ncbi:hypothetical protein [Nocardia vulneris]|uniref:hypothetical protein n=1 Tax=Nocardia vulneris TaxID=1141657 RepID=UPI000AC5C7E8|nr:hypothetical protein [Nocardia vulneris]